jgi:hypothetical protein
VNNAGRAAPERCEFRDRAGDQCRRPRGHEPDVAHVVVDATGKLRVFRPAPGLESQGAWA